MTTSLERTFSMRSRRLRRLLPALLVIACVGGLVQAVDAPSQAAPGSARSKLSHTGPQVKKTKSVPVKSIGSAVKDLTKPVTRSKPAGRAWPKAGRQVAAEARAESWSRPAAGVSVRGGRSTKPTKVTVETVGRLGKPGRAASGYVYRLTSTDVSQRFSKGSKVRLSYADFANAGGGDLANRLKLALVEGCKTSDGFASCKEVTPLETSNDTSARTLTAAMPANQASASSMSVAAVSTPNGSQGDYSASKLSPSSSWSAGNQSGDFNWSYPLDVPPGVNGPEPDLAITYSSGSIDGKVSSTNNQSSWIGDGFDLNPGFVERSYKPCRDVDGAPSTSNDLCWNDDNLTLSLDGSSSQIIRVGTTDEWRMKSDDGSRIERITGAPNGDNNGEYWRLTKTDGTKFYFGRHARFDGDAEPTESVSTVPVFGSKDGQPCNGSTFAASSCKQGWRWALDYVVDTHDNTMTLYYEQETNRYRPNDGSPVSYDRGAHLARIDYGTRRTQENKNAPVRVLFTTKDRKDTDGKWPDVPRDQLCEGTDSCTNKTAPTFFTDQQLTTITTQTLDPSVGTGGTYSPVNRWSLGQEFRDPGDGTSKGLWLKSIAHKGLVGGEADAPTVTFGGTQMDNRVDTIGDHLPKFTKWRVSSINNGTGGQVSVTYSKADCGAGSTPSESSLDSNDRRCFPVWYQPDWTEDRQLEFFQKYRVDAVMESPGIAGTVSVITSYAYGDGRGWHYDDTSLERDKYRTWNQWRGYARVTTSVGASDDTPTYTNTLYMRGMYGNKIQGGGTTTTTVSDPEGFASTDVKDLDRYAGFVRREVTKNGPGGDWTDVTINTPTPESTAPTATDGDGRKAYIVDIAEKEHRTFLTSSSYRTDRVKTTYNAMGMPTKVEDSGDTAVSSDNRCTVVQYISNTDSWIHVPMNSTTTSGACGTTPETEEDVIEAVRNGYDGNAYGVAPTKGDLTLVKAPTSLSDAGTPSFADAGVRTTYDDYGRVTSIKDVLGKTVSTSYSPATGVPTQATVTNPLDQKVTTTTNRAWGSTIQSTDMADAKSDYEYDPLGRVTSIWIPGRQKDSGATPTYKYAYSMRADAASTVTTQKLNWDEDYITSVQFYDGLLRDLETQTPAEGAAGGRVITEKTYDSHGRIKQDRGPYYNSSAVSTTLVSADEVDIPRYTITKYDGANRPVAESLASQGGVKWTSTTAYVGNRTDFTPPSGGTATSTYTDVQGRTTKLLQYTASATPSGASDATTYTYNPAGQPRTITNAAGHVWTNTYDIRGRLKKADDPDKGSTTYTYDGVDRPVTSTNGGETLWTGYDALGRKTALKDDSSGGSTRATWEYDTVRPGYLSSSTRFASSTETYKKSLTYDDAGRVKSEVLTPQLPDASEAKLMKTGGYKSTMTYFPDGSLQSMTQPTLTGLANEALSYSYTPLGNLKTWCGTTCFASNTYSPVGDVLKREAVDTIGKSVYTSFEYDNATRRLTRVWGSFQGSASSPKLDLRYTYDPVGNVTKLNDVAAGDTAQTGASTLRQCFKYDRLRRLTSAYTSSGNTCAAPDSSTAPTNLGSLLPYWNSYTYDSSGNRKTDTAFVGSGTSQKKTTYTYNYPSDPTAPRPHAPTSVGAVTGSTSSTESFSHDDEGNMTANGKYTMTWDPEDHQATVTRKSDSKKVSYVYDTDGNRLLKRDAIAGTVTLYTGFSEVTLTKSGDALSAIRNYALGSSPLATRTSSGVQLLIGDAQGTPVLQVKGSDLTFAKRRYGPFGTELEAKNFASPNGFLGKTLDSTTGTVHLGAREYDPRLGRFLSVDPIGDPSDPQQLNGYAYSNNNPTSSSDPSGLIREWGVDDKGRAITDNRDPGSVPPLSSRPPRPQVPPPPRGDPYDNDARLLSQSYDHYLRTLRQLGAVSAGTLRALDNYQALQRQMQREKTRPQKSAGEIGLAVLRVLFDYQACGSDGGVGSCGAEVAMVLPFTKLGKLGKPLAEVSETVKRSRHAIAAGKAGEEAVRKKHDIGNAVTEAIEMKRGFRKPDGLLPEVISEVKNYRRTLSYTQQLKDYVDFAEETGRRFDLYVRGDSATKLSGPLKKAILEEKINLRLIPGT